MENGLKTYAAPLDDLLQDKYNEEFYDIERILNFHQTEFLPCLKENDGNVFDIATAFHQYISKDSFFDYIFYAMRKPQLEAFIAAHPSLFDTLGTNDKLGINSFLHEPIQRLPRYKLLFAEIIKVSLLIFCFREPLFMSKLLSLLYYAQAISVDDDDAIKDIQRACRIAERDVLTLLTTVNEALNLNQFAESTQVSSFSVYDFFIVF